MDCLCDNKNQARESAFPLKVSSNKRYFVDQNDTPFFILADTGWMIFANINKEDVEFYLDERRKKGINTILCYAAPFRIHHTNVYGQPAFFDNDLSKPNDAYFDNVDTVIKMAKEKGMQIVLGPVESGDYKEFYTLESAGALGRYMGNRYKNFKNIMWFVGGDIHPGQKEIDMCDAVAKGIREYDTNHLISFHPGGGNSSSDWFNYYPWLDYNMVQVFGPESPKHYTWLLADYGKKPIRPTMLAEPCYEENDDLGNPPKMNSPYQIRRAVAWAILSGGCGMFYGHKYVYKYVSEPFWKNYLARPAFLQFSNLGNLLKTCAWYKLAPDWAHTTMIGGYGTYDEMDYAAAARAEDGSFAVVYMPSARPVKFNMARFNGAKTVKWFDITNNTVTEAGTYKNEGVLELPASPENSAGQTDWLLVLE